MILAISWNCCWICKQKEQWLMSRLNLGMCCKGTSSIKLESWDKQWEVWLWVAGRCRCVVATSVHVVLRSVS